MAWKMKGIHFLLLVSCCFAGWGAKAQLRFVSLHELWAYADAHNMQVQAAEAGRAIAGINTRQARGAMLPTVSAGGGFTDNITIQSTLVPANLFNPAAPTGTYTEAIFGRRYIYNGSIGVQFDILNLKDWFGVKAAKLSAEIAVLNFAKTKETLYEQLANTYYSYILLNEAERLSKENIWTAEKSYELAGNKFQEGLISEVTLNTALINKQKAEKSLEATVENKSLLLNNLRLLLNTSDSIVLREELQEAEPLTDSGFSPDPNVQLANMQVMNAKNEWQSSKSSFSPTLSAVYQYNTQIAADDFLKFSNSNTTPQQYWGLRLSMPIFTGGSRKNTVQKAKIDYDLKQKEYESARLQSELTNKNILIEYMSALNAYNKSKNILDLYKRNDLHAERKMNEGIVLLDERLKVYSDLVNNQNEYLQSLSDYLIQHYRLQIRKANFTK
jgi:outer membrane protein